MASRDIDVIYKELTNPQKAALLLIALGQKWAIEIMRLLKEEEVKKISYWIHQMQYVPPELTERIIREFYEKLTQKTSLTSNGGKDYLSEVLSGMMGEGKAQELMESLSHQEENEVFRILKKVDEKQLAAYLKQERPQTIALMMSYLDPARAGKIISSLPADIQADIILRLAKLEEADPEIAWEMEKALTESLGALATDKKKKKIGGVKAVAQVLNNLSKDNEKAIIEQISERDFDLATAIKELMFVFDDLVLLDDKSMQVVLKDVDQNDLVIALKGANEEVRSKVFRNISKRQVESINDELAFMGPVKSSNVAASQQRIIGIIRKLDEEGKILIQGKGGGGDEIIQ